MNILDRIFEMERAIRFVMVMDVQGEVVERRVRKGLKLLMPEDFIKEQFAMRMDIIWRMADEMSRYVGSPSRVVFHHELIDIVAFKVKDAYYIITLDKNVDSDDLSRRLRKLVEQEA
jgi:hypothetical protein